MDQYEKNFDKAANAAGSVLSTAERGYNRLQIGCLTIFFNLFFAAFCIWGVFAANTAWQLEQTGIATEGTVVEMEESSSADSGCCVYSPIIEFSVNGQTYRFEGDVASDPPEYRVGETVPVIYNPADPNTAQINKWVERWLFPLLIIPSMLCAAVLVTFFMVRSWRRGEAIEF